MVLKRSLDNLHGSQSSVSKPTLKQKSGEKGDNEQRHTSSTNKNQHNHNQRKHRKQITNKINQIRHQYPKPIRELKSKIRHKLSRIGQKSLKKR